MLLLCRDDRCLHQFLRRNRYDRLISDFDFRDQGPGTERETMLRRRMTSSADEPLFSLIAGPSVDPSSYTSAPSTTSDGDDTTDASRVCEKKTQFWLESHALSSIQHSSFHSSAELTFRDVMPHSLLSVDESHDEFELVKRIISGESCAHIAADGVIKNTDSKNGNYTTAICQYGEGTKNGSAANHSLSLLTNEQIETIGRCAAHIVTNNNSQCRLQDAAASLVNNEKDSASGNNTTWFQSPIKVAKKVSSVINYAIDSALNLYDGGDYYAAANVELEGADVDDATATMNTLGKISFDDNLDDEQVQRKGGNAITYRMDQEIVISDDVISISSVAMACNHLLQYSQIMKLDDSQELTDFFVLGENIGEVERIMLQRSGWTAGSFGSLCRQAGKYFTSSSKEDDDSEKDAFIRVGIGKILSTISTEGVDLLVATLCQSNYVIMEESTITLFPGGIPSGLKDASSKSDFALYQIHVTKIATQNRIRRLEKDAETAKNSAISYQKKKMTKVALVHMRRRKAALEEIDRCAAVLENLTAGELRLERAKGDVQVIQSYNQLKEALQDVRTSSGMENEDVEELMSEIREEMELANNNALTEAVYNEDAIDEDELYEEFRKLELECDNRTQSPGKSEDATDGREGFPSSKVVPDVGLSTKSPGIDEQHQKSPAKPTLANPMPSS